MKSDMISKLKNKKQRYNESPANIRTVVLIGSLANRIVKFAEEEMSTLLVWEAKT